MYSVRDAIADYIREANIKQSAIAKKTGMTPQSISSIVNRKRGVAADEYYFICEALGLPLDFFFPKKEAQDGQQ